MGGPSYGAAAAKLAAASVRRRLGETATEPVVGIVLGSGLGGLSARIADSVAVPFGDVPGFPRATVVGHAGALIGGMLGGRQVIALAGRFHMYEGHDAALAGFPVRVLHALGVRTLFVSNAAGGIRRTFRAGDLMLIRDHLNLTGRSPLYGQNADAIGPRFQDLTDAWSPRLRAALRAAGDAEEIQLAEGVYAGLLGPQYETPSEVRMLRTLGADAVGMSTVLECIAARWAGLEVCGVSLVTNAGAGYSGEPLTHEEVLAAGAEAGPRLARVIRRFVADLPPARAG